MPKPKPTEAAILRHIAREEPLTATVRAFRGLTRERLGQLLERPPPVSKGVSPIPSAEAPAPAAAPSRRLRLAAPRPACGCTRMARRAGTQAPRAPARCSSSPAGTRGGPARQVPGHPDEQLRRVHGAAARPEARQEPGRRGVEVFADSELLIRQLGGRYQVKSPTLRPLYEEARAAAERLLPGEARPRAARDERRSRRDEQPRHRRAALSLFRASPFRSPAAAG